MALISAYPNAGVFLVVMSFVTDRVRYVVLSQYFHPKYPVSATVSVYVCARARVCVCVCIYIFIILYVDCFGRTMPYMCIEYHI